MFEDMVSARLGFSGAEVLSAWREQGVPEGLLSAAEDWRREAEAADAAAGAALSAGRGVPRASYVYEGREVVEAAMAALLSGEHLLLVGPKATGKNVLAENLAAVFGRPDWNVSFHIQTDAEALLGADTLAKGAVVFRPGPVVEAAQAGGFLVLDEINMARNEALAVLHSLLDDRRMVDVPGHGRVRLSPAARMIATMNYGYAGTRELNEALASRFVVLRLPPLSEAGVVHLLEKACPELSKAGRGVLGKLFSAMEEKHAQGEISSRAVDLRGLLAAVRLMRRGLSPLRALSMGLVDKCMEEDERGIAEDVLQLFVAKEAKPDEFFA